MEEKFLLKHNSYLIFMLNYAPIVIIGIIAALFVHNKLPNFIEFLVVAIIFVVGCWKGLSQLKKNNKLLIIDDQNITIGKYKRKQLVVIKQIANESVNKIDASHVNEAGAYLITKKDDTVEILEISTGLKPDKELVLKINTILYKLFGEKFYLDDKKEIEEYINSNSVPKAIIDADGRIRINRIAWCCVNTLIGFIPTVLGILAVCWLILRFLQFILEFIVKILGS